MKNFLILAVSTAFVLTSVSCGKVDKNDDKENPYAPLNLSTKSSGFVESGNKFSFEFIDKLNSVENKDYIVSPLSLQIALGMLLNGAQGGTAEEIITMLGYGKDEIEEVNDYFLYLLNTLPKMDKKTTMSLADAVFVNKEFPLLDTYKAQVAKSYLAQIDNLDFSDAEKVVGIVNAWCEKNTNGMIPHVLSDVNPNDVAYILNALYFKSMWKHQFKAQYTTDMNFKTESGIGKKVPMMKQGEVFEYFENDIFQAVRLPYGNNAFAMTVFLPAPGHKTSDVTAFLKNGGKYAFETKSVDLWLPKFETKFDIKLNDLLKSMGMKAAFSLGAANFSAFSSEASCVSFVKQNAVIKVDEEGSEAAAVTSIGMANSPGPSFSKDFHADHTFLYLITESSSGVILFAGRYSGEK